MGLFLFAIVWMCAAIAIFGWLFWMHEWHKLAFAGIAWRILACSVGFAPGLIVMHDVAVMPLPIALLTQPTSELASWNLLGWFIVFVSCTIAAAILARRGSSDPVERSAADAP